MLFVQWRFVNEAIPAFSAYRYEYAAIYLSNIFFVIMAVVFMGSIKPKQSTLNLRLWGRNSFILGNLSRAKRRYDCCYILSYVFLLYLVANNGRISDYRIHNELFE